MRWSEVSPRERDAAIAEKVMGAPPPTANVPLGALSGLRTYTHGSGAWTGTTDGYASGDNPVWVPLPYTTSITSAWEVVEKMAAEGWSIAVWNDGRVEVTREDDNAAYLQVDADTAPEGICIAALRAMGVEVTV